MRKFPLKRRVLHVTLAVMLFTFSMPSAVFSQALSSTTNDFVPFAQINIVPCANGGAGELVLVSGTLHIQSHVTINDNRVRLKTLFQPQGATGLGLTTGDVYRATGLTQFMDTIPLLQGSQTFTIINNFRLIGPGTDNNFQVHQEIHLTINANGEITSQVDHTSVECN